MKKQLLTGIIATFASVCAFSQTVPNGSFEYWTSSTYDILVGFDNNSNVRSLQQINMNTAVKTTDFYHGAYAIKLTTQTDGRDTLFGYFATGNPGNPGRGGTPYSLKPTGLRGYYKSNVPAGDTALVVVQFKSAGTTIFFGTQKLYGVHNSYTMFNMPISLPVTPLPDTIIFGAVSSNATANNFKGIPGSMLQVDSLTFTGVLAQPTGMNGDFENWTTGTVMKPNGWELTGDSAMRSTVAYTGSYALELQITNNPNGGGINSDGATTGHFTNNGPSRGGYPFTLMNDSLVGYYKLLANGTDTANISWNATNMTTMVGGGGMPLPPSATYRRFSMPINPGSTPDTLQVDIMAANYWPIAPAKVGSKLYVDAVQLLSQPLAVPMLVMGTDVFSTYPNPSSGHFNLLYDSGRDGAVKITVYNLVGQEVQNLQLPGTGEQRVEMDLSGFGKGVYLLKAEQAGKVSMQRIIVE